ncbi:hypothetical protein F5888DRAFT_799734 [Russula emetica]|nr:hypothetical protein F5888DRAFT_799734 [Russula emetica]
MSSQEYQPPIFRIPSQPSGQLKVVLDYFNCLKTWDLETLSKLSTSGFTQATLPASLGVPVRSKSEDIEFLHTFRDSLKGAPLEVCTHTDIFFPDLAVCELTLVRSKIIIYDVSEDSEEGKIWVHLMMKTVNVECLFLFTFGTGDEDDDDENLIINVTEFVDSKVFSGGDGGDKNDDGSGNNNSAHPDAQPETPFQGLSSSVRNCIKAMGRCYLDILLFAPRSIKYVMNTSK